MSVSTRHRIALLRIIGLALAVFGMIGVADAAVFDDLCVQGWYGTGVNRAALVVDFWPGNGVDDSFAFGVNFGDDVTDTISGYELLELVHEGTSDADGPSYAFNFASADGGTETGHLIGEMWYTDPKTDILYDAVYNWPNSWLSYWISPDGGHTWNFPVIDTDHWLSVDTRQLGNNDTDGWLAKPGGDNTDFASTPVAPIPEPSTITLTLIGFMAIFLRNRSRKSQI